MQNLPTLRKPQAKEAVEVRTFVGLVQRGIEAWEAAGKHLVLMIESDKEFISRVRKSHPEISMDMLTVFERIGRKQIYAPLLANSSMAARRLLELPYDAQEKYANGTIEVVVSAKSGNIKTVKKRLDELSRAEINNVFSFDRVNSVEQQVKAMKARDECRAGSFAPSAAVIVPRKDAGCYRLYFDGETVKAERCAKNGREYSVRLTQGKNGPEAFISFYQ